MFQEQQKLFECESEWKENLAKQDTHSRSLKIEVQLLPVLINYDRLTVFKKSFRLNLLVPNKIRGATVRVKLKEWKEIETIITKPVERRLMMNGFRPSISLAHMALM